MLVARVVIFGVHISDPCYRLLSLDDEAAEWLKYSPQNVFFGLVYSGQCIMFYPKWRAFDAEHSAFRRSCI